MFWIFPPVNRFEISLAASIAIAVFFLTSVAIIIVTSRFAKNRRRLETINERYRQLNERFEVALSSAPLSVFTQDMELRYTWVNNAVEGLASHDLIGKRDEDLWDEAFANTVVAFKRRVLRDGKSERQTFTLEWKGRVIHYDVTVVPMKNDRGDVTGLVGAAVDVTAVTQLQTQFSSTQRLLQAILDHSSAIIYMRRVDGTEIMVNQGFADLAGRPIEDIIGRNDDELFPSSALESIRENDRHVFQTGEVLTFEETLILPDGEHTYVSVKMPVDYLGERLICGVTTDITFMKQLEKRLLEINASLEARVAERTAELRRLAQELTQIESRERRRLAQTLHDGLQQILVAAKMRLDFLCTTLKSREHEEISKTIEYLTAAIALSRNLTADLYPTLLFDRGLHAALEWLARRYHEQHELKIALQLAPDSEPDREDVRIFLFEVARELLLNAVKHAPDSTVELELTHDRHHGICMTYRDNGPGFDLEYYHQSDEQGFGLFSIKQRTELFEGSFEVQSQPGQGTQVAIACPVCVAATSPAQPAATSTD